VRQATSCARSDVRRAHGHSLSSFYYDATTVANWLTGQPVKIPFMPSRDPERSREALLAAAEQLFARQGFEQTTMQQVGETAGFARSTPAYFFKSKEALYRAVLERVVARQQAALAPAYALVADTTDPAQALPALIDGFIDFLVSERTFVRLLQREALSGRPWVKEIAQAGAVQNTLAALAPIAEPVDVDPAHLIVSLVALCWFPFAHATTLLQALEIDPYRDDFVERHKREVLAFALGRITSAGRRRRHR
jgi:AcrR family transcriptional regulator